jgi:hypothetical protein
MTTRRIIAGIASLGLVLAAAASVAAGPPTLRVDPPAAKGSMAPNLLADGPDVFLSWLEPAEPAGTRRLRYAAWRDGAWSKPVTIATRSDFFANWADVPTMGRGADGAMYAQWLQRTRDGGAFYDAVIARHTRDSTGDTRWVVLGPLHDDGTVSEHGFVSLLPGDPGVRAFWLDGRAMTAGDHGHGIGNMTLRTTVVDRGVESSTVLDHRVCECCSTSAALASNGPIIVYRDRSMEEERDIFIVRSVDGDWTKPRPVHRDGWEIAGCPVNGPSVAAAGDAVVVAWYTAAQLRPRVLAAWSRDGGATFAPPVVIDDDDPTGRVAVGLDRDGSAVIAWHARGVDDAVITLRRLTRDGAASAPVEVARTNPGRASGLPRLARTPDGWLVVWTDADAHRLRAGLVADLADVREEAP